LHSTAKPVWRGRENPIYEENPAVEPFLEKFSFAVPGAVIFQPSPDMATPASARSIRIGSARQFPVVHRGAVSVPYASLRSTRRGTSTADFLRDVRKFVPA
jgi:hypothetical protein